MKETFVYADKDGQSLELDVYRNDSLNRKCPCMLFLFGGGFMTGDRNKPAYRNYFEFLLRNNITVVSIDYRLGMQEHKDNFFRYPEAMDNSIRMAVEDLFDATKFILHCCNDLQIDSNCIMVSGSSAGAITALQADFISKNHKMKYSATLPKSFQYAAIIAFSGGIYSSEGSFVYDAKPAPTLLIHGALDELVIFDRLELFDERFYGPKAISEIFDTMNVPYQMFVYPDKGHEVASLAMDEKQNEVLQFLHDYVFKTD